MNGHPLPCIRTPFPYLNPSSFGNNRFLLFASLVFILVVALVRGHLQLVRVRLVGAAGLFAALVVVRLLVEIEQVLVVLL